ncbi:MAG: tRNA lysidine(34) synthetase TilS [Tetrasphaera sp.]
MREPASMACRAAVREALADLPAGSQVLIACSGGPDSLALAAATAWVAERRGVSAGAVCVDHRLQDGSWEVARRAAEDCRRLGLGPVQIVSVDVPVGTGDGPEAAARGARYAALGAAAADLGAAAILLGHTRDDQAEQVLLGLIRGAGVRSLAGMPPARGLLRRPFLRLSRADTAASCAELGLTPWNDPHNADDRFARVRVRRLLADLTERVDPAIGAALARTAALARVDADYLDAQAGEALERLGAPPWPVPALAALEPAIRGRVWRAGLIAAGAPAGGLALRHTDACDRLLTRWRGQGAIAIPGGLSVHRRDGQVVITPRPAVD